MELLHERCAALDIGKKDLKACVRTPSPTGKRSRRQEIRTFATTTNALLELRDWLLGERVSLVVMEATGDYWRGAFYLLEDDLNVILVNAAHAKGLPGRTTDVCDAAWLCQLGECGLLRASFVPPEPIRQLRDLTRYRTTLTTERTCEAQRLEKELEDAGIKLSSVATDIFGVSGRAMLTALIDGERDPRVLYRSRRRLLRPPRPPTRHAPHRPPSQHPRVHRPLRPDPGRLTTHTTGCNTTNTKSPREPRLTHHFRTRKCGLGLC